MEFEDFFWHKPPIVDLRAENRWDAINELMDHLVAQQQVRREDRDQIVASVKKRETSMSTGIGFGIGLPHASTDLVTGVISIRGRSQKGIPFDSLDDKPVNLVWLFLVPAGDFQKQLYTLANLAKLLHRKGFRDGLF